MEFTYNGKVTVHSKKWKEVTSEVILSQNCIYQFIGSIIKKNG